jgi:soluble lytic murein transglycosylase
VERYIALSAAQQHLPAAHEWLAALPQDVRDLRVREWQVRAALENRDWPAVIADIRAMPADEQDADEWRYWHAVALQHSDRRTQAINRFTLLARERSYHGFLAADFLDWPYEMGNDPLQYEPEALEALAKKPGLVRARELYLADLMPDARREWAYATQAMTPEELKLAASLAGQWGWNDNAIFTVAQARDYADLKLRFPLDHAGSVQRHAAHSDLDPGYVFAVIRQESAFNKDATSPAGARGLMQLMPATGKMTARENRIPWAGTHSLFDIDRNIQLGTRYLRQVMDRFDNNMVLASAAYNAGPHRVRRWLPEEGSRAADVWIATIPYRETRKYVQRILAYTAIYDWRMERPLTRLAERMPAIYPESRYGRSGS